MGMSTRVYGVRDLDGRFAEMIQVKLLCEKTNISYPAEVVDYFKYPEEDENYLKREMELVDLSGLVAHQFDGDMTEGWQVDISKLPDGIKAIRFENSY